GGDSVALCRRKVSNDLDRVVRLSKTNALGLTQQERANGEQGKHGTPPMENCKFAVANCQLKTPPTLGYSICNFQWSILNLQLHSAINWRDNENAARLTPASDRAGRAAS